MDLAADTAWTELGGNGTAPSPFRPTPDARSFRICAWLFRRLQPLVCRFRVSKTIRVPTDRPVLFAANHRSLWDATAAYAAFSTFGLSSRLIVEERYFRTRLLGWALRSTGAIPMSSDVRSDAEGTAVAALRAGQSVSIMPEGRIVAAEDRLDGAGQFRVGLSRIATTADAVVLPVAIRGTDLVWPRHGRLRVRLFRRPDVTVRLGDPIEFTSDDHRANADRVRATIVAMLAELDAEAA